MAEWPIMSLREAGVILIDCVHATPAAEPFGYPYIAIPDMKDGRIDFSKARRISEIDFEKWTTKARPRRHDVVLSRRTNPGVTATVGEECAFALGQNLVLLRADGSRVLPEFLKWLVAGPDWWAQISKFLNVGAVFDSLKCADVPRFQLPIPPRHEQQRIVSILGALDDKIDLNRRMNETLEAMARALFKDWFVDFGPTRAKMEGRAPYLASDLWALFPDRLDDDGKPEGWEVSSIGEEIRVAGGSTPRTTEPAYWDGDIAWATPKDLSRLDAPVLFETERLITHAGLSQISSGLLPKGTVLLSSRAPIGYVAITEIPVAVNQGFIGMVCEGRLSNVFCWLWTIFRMDEIKQRANGSTFLEISKSNFRPIPVTVASRRILFAFDQMVRPLFTRIAHNEDESRTLAATRDLLLPKLMSGEIRVRDAEKMVEPAL